eukprot:6199742-Pleurochrysis_carterae.AAC.1
MRFVTPSVRVRMLGRALGFPASCVPSRAFRHRCLLTSNLGARLSSWPPTSPRADWTSRRERARCMHARGMQEQYDSPNRNARERVCRRQCMHTAACAMCACVQDAPT